MKFKATEQAPILEFLIAKLKLGSITKARKLLKHGDVKINQRTVMRAETLVQPGDEVQVAKSGSAKLKRVPFELLYQDEYVLVAVKPAGVLSVNRENEDSRTFHKIINEYVREVSGYTERVFVVHRLDREVSGVMIFAKSLEIQRLLEDAWKSNDKLYYALVEGAPPQNEGRVESWLAENAALKVYSSKEGPDAKLAITHYRIVKKAGPLTLVEVRLETGRKNQIRVHMSDLGCPIVGDVKYGAKSDVMGRIALHAFRFAFNHPVTGKRLSFDAPMPKEIEALMVKNKNRG
jgi:23S rRNA pseudouridine1911/1915/1917 synthase